MTGGSSDSKQWGRPAGGVQRRHQRATAATRLIVRCSDKIEIIRFKGVIWSPILGIRTPLSN
ncbi:hypothetical protein CUMW_064820 [Citrus unshiu]|nr:hypothetical protein CUMW_064820 [Citrus unshiu]